MVLRDTPVRRSISRIAKPCRSRSLRITFSSPMSITPLAPSLFARGRVTWVKSQWKLRAHPGHFSLEINTCALPRIASVPWTSAPRIAAPRLGALNTVSINRASPQTLLNTAADTLHIVSRKKSRRGVSRNIVYLQITRCRPSLLSQIRRDPLLIAVFFAHLRARRPLRAHTQAERYGHEISSSCRCPVEQHRWRCIR